MNLETWAQFQNGEPNMTNGTECGAMGRWCGVTGHVENQKGGREKIQTELGTLSAKKTMEDRTT